MRPSGSILDRTTARNFLSINYGWKVGSTSRDECDADKYAGGARFFVRRMRHTRARQVAFVKTDMMDIAAMTSKSALPSSASRLSSRASAARTGTAPLRRSRTASSGRRRRTGTAVSAKMSEEPKYVRDSRDERKETSPADAGRTTRDVEVFRDALGSVAAADSPMTQTLHKEFGVEGRVRVRDGRGGATKVLLTHPSGAYADVYLKGGNVVSWTLANGGEVFYVPEDATFKKHAPTDGGNPIAFPQFGVGGERPGSVANANPKMPEDGFANKMEWRIGETGTYTSEDGSNCPFLALEATDDDSTRAVFPHSFKLSMEISLEYSALRIKTTVQNTGASKFEYALGYKAHVAVNDAREGDVYYVGFEDCVALDNMVHPTKPRVRFTNDLPVLEERCFRLREKTDRVYLSTDHRDTGVEVGTGCTFYAQNLSGESGCIDRAVFTPWEESPQTYRWYAGLAIGNFGKLRIAEPDSKSSVEVQYKIVDKTPSLAIRDEIAMLEKVNARAALTRPKLDLSDTDLPVDLQ